MRDTLRGNTIENRDISLFLYIICVDLCMSFYTLALTYFVFPNCTKQNPLHPQKKIQSGKQLDF